MPESIANRAVTPDLEHYRQFGERVFGEIFMAAGMLGVSMAELCRKAGYNKSYVTNLRRPEGRQKGYLPTLRFLADVERAWGVKFQMTVTPGTSFDHGEPHLRRPKEEGRAPKWRVTCLDGCGWDGYRHAPDRETAGERPCPECGKPLTVRVVGNG